MKLLAAKSICSKIDPSTRGLRGVSRELGSVKGRHFTRGNLIRKWQDVLLASLFVYKNLRNLSLVTQLGQSPFPTRVYDVTVCSYPLRLPIGRLSGDLARPLTRVAGT